MAGIKAGCVVVNRFCRSNDKVFSAYINYIEGSQEERQEHLSKYNLYNDYMEDEEKSTGLFMSGKTELTKEDKKSLKEVFKTAQDNGSLMWQSVISFDNRWLEMNGLYDRKTGIADEKRLKAYTIDAVNSMLKNEGLENAVWSAGIHYNTDNLHVHIAIVEPEPHREMKAVRQYKYTRAVNGDYVKVSNGEIVRANGRNEVGKWGIPYPRYNQELLYDDKGQPLTKLEYNGRFKGKSIEICKKQVVDAVLDQKENNILLNNIIRERIVKKKQEHPLLKDENLKELFLELYAHMPQDVNRNLWNYNNNIMTSIRPEIDALTEHYLKIYSSEDYKEFSELLKRQSDFYKIAYGGQGRDFEKNKQKELFERMGNAILKEIRDYDKRIKLLEITEQDFREEARVEDPDEPQVITLEPSELNQDKISENGWNISWSAEWKKARRLIFDKNPDYERARTLLESEIEKGNVLAYEELGNFYKYGRGVQIDLDKANEYYQKSHEGFLNLSNSENKKLLPYTWYRLGKNWQKGIGVDEDQKKAFEMFNRSMMSEKSYACFSLGNMYFHGKGTEKNYEEAFRCFEKASEKGNAYADYKLAEMHENGWGTAVDAEEAKEYYKRAFQGFVALEEKNGDDNIQYKIGLMFLQGKGVEENQDIAKEYLDLSAKNGNPYAQYRLAKLLLSSGNIDEIEKAESLLRKSADKGKNKMAQYALGKFYMNDENEKKDLKAAEYWLKTAIKNGFANAEYDLGKLYLTANSSVFNPEKGIGLLKHLSEKGNHYASLKLGTLYLKGDIVKKNVPLGKAYLVKAAGEGNEYAKKMLIEFNETSNSGKVSIQKQFAATKRKAAYELELALIKLKKSLNNAKEKFFNEQEFRKLQSKEHQEER